MKAQKLTLSIKPGTIVRAKEYAKEKHVSLSKLFESYLNEILDKKDTPVLISENEIPDDILKLTGILKGKVTDDINISDAKYEYLKEKYDLR